MNPDAENQVLSSQKILVADDCKDHRDLIELALSNEPYLLKFCENGTDAIDEFVVFKPALVILDIQMPGATGIEVCQWIKQRSKNDFTPVILLTSQSELVDKVSGLNCGADEYMTKPFSLPELLARIRALLRIKELTDRLRETRSLLEQKDKQLVAMQVAGAAAHELGQPLTALLLDCELLSRIVNATADVEETLTRIEAQCNQMRTILNRLNRLSAYRTRDYLHGLEIVDLSEEEQREL